MKAAKRISTCCKKGGRRLLTAATLLQVSRRATVMAAQLSSLGASVRGAGKARRGAHLTSAAVKLIQFAERMRVFAQCRAACG